MKAPALGFRVTWFRVQGLRGLDLGLPAWGVLGFRVQGTGLCQASNFPELLTGFEGSSQDG